MPQLVSRSNWFIQLDHIALEVDAGVTTYDHTMCKHMHDPNAAKFDIQPTTKSVLVNPQLTLRNMLVREAEIARRAHASEASCGRNLDKMRHADDISESRFTYGPLNDHIHATRREYLARFIIKRKELWHCLNDVERLSQLPKGRVNEFYSQTLTKDILQVENAAMDVMRLRRGE